MNQPLSPAVEAAPRAAAPRAAQPVALNFATDAERFDSFGKALDAIKIKIEGQIGDEDLQYVRRMNRFSRAMEVVGRLCLHFSVEPITWSAGVFALWIHKQLQATEVGHTALHGAYDRFPEAKDLHQANFRWHTPIDEASWRHGHNVRHHGNTNVTGKDPDIHFGQVRLTEYTPWSARQKFQLPFALAVLFPNFGFLMNLHFTGVSDYWFGNERGGMDFLTERTPQTRRKAHLAALRKYVPYYAKEFGLFPLLAGPLFWKVLLGNWLSETMRDVYSAATIYCGHVGEETAAYPEGTHARGRGHWYAMQVEATNNFEVSLPVSVLCGGLDCQIEHHLFPKFAPPRLRQIAPEVRAVCEAHGVTYRTDTWGRTLKKALGYIAKLSKESPSTGAAVRDVVRAMA